VPEPLSAPRLEEPRRLQLDTERSVARELAALTKMNMAALRARYREAFGEDTTSHNAAYLRKQLAWRIQELAEGGLSDRVRARIAELQGSAPLRERPPGVASAAPAAAQAIASAARDPGLPPVGTTLRRTYLGAMHEVTVTEDGFVYRGKTHASLSTIAKIITGTTWNGRLFFGLTTRKRKEAA
jgi:hypothetical protein